MNFIWRTDKASLRYQINIRILFSSLCILILGGLLALWQARDAVDKEVESSIRLAMQLIKIGFSQSLPTALNEEAWLTQLNSLEETRHLSIQLIKSSGQIINFAQNKHQKVHENIPPAWFIKLVASDYPEVKYRITDLAGNELTLMIEADPLDEITEAWKESIAFFGTVCLLILFTFLAVNLVFNKALKSIAVIVESLQRIETGQYKRKLPEFSTKEYDSIAKAINHMTSVMDAAEQENCALTQHSLEIQEEERQRLAQELHDELGQSLTAIKVMAAAAAHDQSDTKKITQSIISICEHLMSVVRSMMHQLHPIMLSELGLKATLEDLTSQWSERNPEVSLSLLCTDEIDRLKKNIGIHVFRVIQECLTNIIRHAHASEVTIILKIIKQQKKMLVLQVIDDGQGCDRNKVACGFGLLSMQERVKSLGGELAIHSVPLQGTTIKANIPLT
jgi:two-component system, NarL family, sensor histidine kinase UhpB